MISKSIEKRPLSFNPKAKATLILVFLAFCLYGAGLYLTRTGPVKSFVIGDLGGVPVAIPKAYANFVEYNQDQSHIEKRGLSANKRNYQSKLSSFGFEVRYPNMAPNANSQSKDSIFTTNWMRVGITAGEAYGSSGDVSLDRRMEFYLDASRSCKSKCFIYVPMPGNIHGLTGYTPTGSGVDIEGRKINFGRGTDLRDKNIYVLQDENGRVRTLIECNNRAHEATRCEQYFNLDPLMKAHVRVNYRKSLLPHWQEIQKSTTELIYGFRVKTKDFK